MPLFMIRFNKYIFYNEDIVVYNKNILPVKGKLNPAIDLNKIN